MASLSHLPVILPEPLSFERLCHCLQARCVGQSSKKYVTAISTDHRYLTENCLLVCLKGPRFDGHDFLHQADRQQRIACLVERLDEKLLQQQPEVIQLEVSDTLYALGEIARYSRQQRNDFSKVIAVTGSNGKTTVKEMIAQALQPLGGIHKTQGNLNNLIGTPLTILDWPLQAKAAVIEMGMSEPLEIARMTDIAQPDIGVITFVGKAHLGGKGLGSLEAIAHAKCELFARMPEDGICLYQGDQPLLQQTAEKFLGKRRFLRFGEQNHNDVRLLHHEHTSNGQHLWVDVLGQKLDFYLPLLGKHNAFNALIALAVAKHLGLCLQQVAKEQLSQLLVVPQRLQSRYLASSELLVIDDCYNANPDSMIAAFEAVRTVPRQGKLYAVLGDMLELGSQAAKEHEAIGYQAILSGFSGLWSYGQHAEDVVRGARRALTSTSKSDNAADAADVADRAFAQSWQGDLHALAKTILTMSKAGDVLLVKSSRGIHLERLVDALFAKEIF